MAHRHMNVDIVTEAPIFLFWEYLFRNFGILSLQCVGLGIFLEILLECSGLRPLGMPVRRSGSV